jgi:hypothetical protein
LAQNFFGVEQAELLRRTCQQSTAPSACGVVVSTFTHFSTSCTVPPSLLCCFDMDVRLPFMDTIEGALQHFEAAAR